MNQMGDVGAQGNATEADKYALKSALNRVQDVNVISTRCREISITGCINKCICLGNAFASGHLVVEVAQLAALDEATHTEASAEAV